MAWREAIQGMAAPADNRVRWKLKARLQNAIASLPFASTDVYVALQRAFGGLRKGLNHPVERFRAAIQMVDWIEAAGANIAAKRFVEVGTGHMVNVPIALWLMGAGETITVDLNRYLSEPLVRESMQYIRQNRAEIVSLFGRRGKDAGFQTRLDRLVEFSGSLYDLLAMMNVRYVSPGDATALPLASHEIDFHISNTVLEHVPTRVLADMLREARRILVPGGMIVHIIDPSDHFSHSDSSISSINFLRFTEKEWMRWAGNRFMYHNRLRGSQYLEIFRKSGVHIVRSEATVDAAAVAILDSGFPVDAGFSQIAVADLATTTLCVLGVFDTI